MKMERNANVVRGWPYDGSLDRAEAIKSGTTLVNGDWVTKTTGNVVDLAGATKTAAAGLVISGNGDSGSAAYTSKAVVIWGNFIVQTKNLPAAVTFTPGAAVCVQNGKLQLATVGTDPVIGFVLDVIAASTADDASIIVKIN